MDSKIKEQILEIRALGETNMFDVPKVQVIALREGYCELVVFLSEDRPAYVHFILTGDD